MGIRCFDSEMPNVQVFRCVCPHCGHERLAVDNGRTIQARFTRSAYDSTCVKCEQCGQWFERKTGMTPIGVIEPTFSLSGLAV